MKKCLAGKEKDLHFLFVCLEVVNNVSGCAGLRTISLCVHVILTLKPAGKGVRKRRYFFLFGLSLRASV